MTYTDAFKTLAGSDLRMTSTSRTSDDTPGLVIDQAPKADEAVSRGSTVSVILSYSDLIEVPDVVGSQLSNAKLRLRKLLGISTRPQESIRPDGEVLEQKPTRGARVKRGSEIELFVSDGSLVEVPDVLTLPLAQARSALANAGLSGSPREESSNAPIGTVTAQDPVGRSTAKRDGVVSLSVSAGTALPSVVGRSIDEAKGVLQRFVVTATAVDSPRQTGQVLQQTPPAGTPVAGRASVNLLVSNGSLVTVPELLGLSLAQAESRLKAHGLLPGAHNWLTFDSAVVDASEPAADAVVKRGSTVQLTLRLPTSIWVAGTILLLASVAVTWLKLRSGSRVEPTSTEDRAPAEQDSMPDPTSGETRYSAGIDFNSRPVEVSTGGAEAPAVGLRAELVRGHVRVWFHKEELI